ncbi:pyridoxamine 5'-phosphate oxidase family protein [Myxococcota bacterium]|nr:pyridoxamine 5'-phosphate oxidase family protein [Myxococcota bacterium]
MVNRISSSEVETILEKWPVARLATIDELDRPRQIPIVFVRNSSGLWSPIDGKPKRSHRLSRLEQIRLHPNVSLLLDHYEENWNRLWWLRIEATASIVSLDDNLDLRKELEGLLQKKYSQYSQTETFLGTPTAIKLSISKYATWVANMSEFKKALDVIVQK